MHKHKGVLHSVHTRFTYAVENWRLVQALQSDSEGNITSSPPLPVLQLYGTVHSLASRNLGSRPGRARTERNASLILNAAGNNNAVVVMFVEFDEEAYLIVGELLHTTLKGPNKTVKPNQGPGHVS